MKEMLIRSATGILFLAIMIGSMLWHPLAFSGVLLLMAAGGIHEAFTLFSRITEKFLHPLLSSLLITSTGLFLVSVHTEESIYAYLTLLLISGYVLWGAIQNRRATSMIMYPLFFVAVPVGLLAYFHNQTFYELTALWFFVLVWTNDTFAYVGGKLFGKKKLASEISPSKTVEGTAIGILMATVAGMLIAYFNEFSVFTYTCAGLTVGAFSVLGDLAESKLKRLAKVKDSGNLLPGHGGILDRFDGALTAVIPFWVLMYLSNL